MMLEIKMPENDAQGFSTVTMDPGNPGSVWGPVPMHHLVREVKLHPDVRIATHQ